MTGTNNFLPFDSTNANMMTDSVYAASTVRTNGVVTGQADPTSHNKALHQSTSMAAALANLIANNGTNVSDADLTALTAALSSLFNYQTAQGTATAPILNAAIVNGCPVRFIANSNNGGAATSINGIPLYSLNAANPILLAGQAYIAWYNSTNNCFYTNAAAKVKTEIARFLASSTWVAPPGVTNIDVFVCGAGGGGGSEYAAGGGGGYCKMFYNLAVIPGTSYPAIIGLGGAGGVNSGNGAAGGQSYFNTTANSANGGLSGAYGAGGNGGSGGGSGNNGNGTGGSSGNNGCGGGFGGIGGGNISYTPINPYDGIAYGCGGGSAATSSNIGSIGGGAGSGSMGGGGRGGDDATPTGANGGTTGGGGGGYSTYAGGAGGSGIIIIYA